MRVEQGTVIASRYLIERELGAGGMGAVYRASDLRPAQPVALKGTLAGSQELRSRSQREARIGAKPACFLVAPDGATYLGDFGLATAVGEPSGSGLATPPSLGYAPHLVRGATS